MPDIIRCFSTVLLYFLVLLVSYHASTCTVVSLSTTASSTSAPSLVSRSVFLSSSAASILLGTLSGAIAQDCPAAQAAAAATKDSTMSSGNSFPRYIDRELEVQYAEDRGGTPRTSKVLVRRITGDSTPYQFPIRPIPLTKEWPQEPPFVPQDFFRTDNNQDAWFYTVPKLVYHIDEPAVAALTQFYRKTIPKGSKILDIASSWTSHYPMEFPSTMSQICATGISSSELERNDQLKPPGCYAARDLNDNPTLPYDDASFDVVTCVVSIDYLIHPIQVLKEVHRVLKPGGQMFVSQSNRCFPTKAIAMWLKMDNDIEHLELIDGYFQYAGGFLPRKAFDITAIVPNEEDEGYHDPMYMVQAVKKRA